MARNSEKRHSKLNRFLEAKNETERKEGGKGGLTSSHRPPLYQIKTAEDVKKWIPSINKEIHYCLQQLEGVASRCYPERKIREFEERVQFLEAEHKRFVRKVQALDPQCTEIPWKPRSYTRKRPREVRHMVKMLRNEELRSPLLQTEPTSEVSSIPEEEWSSRVHHTNLTLTSGPPLLQPLPHCYSLPPSSPSSRPSFPSYPLSNLSRSPIFPQPKDVETNRRSTILGLDYSSSSSEEETDA